MMSDPGPLLSNSQFATYFNRLRSMILANRTIAGRGLRSKETPQGRILEAYAVGGSAQSSGLSKYRLKSVSDDYIAAVSWDGTNEGTTTIYIAKPEELRCSNLGPETKLAADYTYAYSAGPDGNNKFRVSTTSGVPDENQLVTPPWIVNGVIYAANASTGLKDPSGKSISLLVISPARIWAKVS